MSNNNSEEKSHSPFSEDVYDIDMSVEDGQHLTPPERWAFVQHISELSRKIFLSLFRLVASESLKDNYTKNIEDEFGNIVNVLFQNFKIKHLDEKGSLEGSIENYITRLGNFKYYLPEIFFKSENFLDPNNYDIKPNEFGSYKCDLDTLTKIFHDILVLLREEKITFWRELLEKYKEDREGYNLSFRTKKGRIDKDLDRFSKISKEELENAFKDLK